MRPESVSSQSQEPGHQDANKLPPSCLEGEVLADILADMVRSALCWEASHGRPPTSLDAQNNKALKRIDPRSDKSTTRES